VGAEGGEAPAFDPVLADEPAALADVGAGDEPGLLDTVFSGIADVAEGGAGRGPAPWVAAGLLAAAACEIARRQVRRGPAPAPAWAGPAPDWSEDVSVTPPGDVP
jgi:hypothetical protein